ncbi:MAG TPA: SdpI family protein [Oscillospiraceae bacterium]|nr:SdpI family protein [Oscillospiraceae bacterium]
MNKGTEKGSILKIAYWILAILPLIVTLFVLPGAPATVPAHYGLNSMADRWSSKYELLVFPTIVLILALIGRIYAHYYRSKENSKEENDNRISADRKALLTGMLIGVAILNAVTYIMLYTSCNKIQDLSATNHDRIIALALNLFYIIMGNIMPKLKQNHFAGIRLSWTLNNEEVWYRTHRFGGKLWVIGGILLAVVCLVVPSTFAMPISIAGLIIMTVIVCFYAHREYVRITGEQNK